MEYDVVHALNFGTQRASSRRHFHGERRRFMSKKQEKQTKPTQNQSNNRGRDDTQSLIASAEESDKILKLSENIEHQSYDPAELAPGGSGKQENQQEFGQDREKRRDKSKNSGDSDKLHGE